VLFEQIPAGNAESCFGTKANPNIGFAVMIRLSLGDTGLIFKKNLGTPDVFA